MTDATEVVAWQWRKKGDPWSLERTFNSEVFATTPDSEVRPLFAAAELVAASPAAAAGVPTGWKLVEDFHVGDYVIFDGVEHVIYALGDKLGTFDIMLPSRTGDRWRNVPPSVLKYGLGTALLAASPVAPVGAPTARMLTDDELLALMEFADGSEFSVYETDHALIAKFCEVNGIALVSAGAPTQERQRDHSVHLAAPQNDQDIRRRPASSEAAPSAPHCRVQSHPLTDEQRKLLSCPGVDFIPGTQGSEPPAQGPHVLPCEVKVGGNTFRKGVSLDIFVRAAQRWHREAYPDWYKLTEEQKAANLAMLRGENIYE